MKTNIVLWCMIVSCAAVPVLAQAATTALVYDKKADTCSEVIGQNTKYTPDNLSSRNVITPEYDATYSFVKDHTTVSGGAEYDSMLKGVQVTVVTPPKHGKLLPVQVNENKGYFYMAEPGYFGVDKVVFSIKFGNGKTILLTNHVSVVGYPTEYTHEAPCTYTPDDYRKMQENLPEIKQKWERLNESTNDSLTVTPLLSFADLPAAGQTTE